MIEEVAQVVLEKRLYKLLEEENTGKRSLPHSRLSDKHRSIKSLSSGINTEGMDRKD